MQDSKHRKTIIDKLVSLFIEPLQGICRLEQHTKFPLRTHRRRTERRV